MANLLLQVTIPAGGKARLSDSLPSGMQPNTFVQQLLIQNNSGDIVRVGDDTVSATKGIIINATGAFGPGSFMNYGLYLSDVWLFGTSGDVVDVFFVQ